MPNIRLIMVLMIQNTTNDIKESVVAVTLYKFKILNIIGLIYLVFNICYIVSNALSENLTYRNALINFLFLLIFFVIEIVIIYIECKKVDKNNKNNSRVKINQISFEDKMCIKETLTNEQKFFEFDEIRVVITSSNVITLLSYTNEIIVISKNNMNENQIFEFYKIIDEHYIKRKKSLINLAEKI